MDIPSLLRHAFPRVFGDIYFKKGTKPSGQSFVALDVKSNIQWNIDYDPEELCVKFGINIENKDDLRVLFNTNSLETKLTETIQVLPKDIIVRVYQQDSMQGRELVIFEKPAPYANITEAIGKIQALLTSAPYPKPHFHVYTVIWKQGDPETRKHLVEGIEPTKDVLQPVMDVLTTAVTY